MVIGPEPSRAQGPAPKARLVPSSAPAPQWVWEVEGPPGAPAIMLLHGWMATAALNWYPSMSYLGRYFRVVAPNLRGHGRQGCAGPPFSLAGCSDDIAALIEELALKDVIAVGYSMGGAVAQVLARRHRDLLGGIVLCATGAHFAERIRLRPVVRLAGALGSGVARGWPEGSAAFLRWRLARHDLAVSARRSRGEAVTPPPEDSAQLEERTLSHLAAFIESGAELNAYDSSPWLPTLDLPSAALITMRDQMVAPWRQEKMASLLPNCRRYFVDAGHDAVLSASGTFLPVLVKACSDLAK